MAVYVNQSYLTITIDTGISLGGASAPKINFRRPDGTRGSWTATIIGNILTYDLQPGDLNKSGIWKLQGEFTIAGRTGYTLIVDLDVEKGI
jgi:hypothetical protein